MTHEPSRFAARCVHRSSERRLPPHGIGTGPSGRVLRSVSWEVHLDLGGSASCGSDSSGRVTVALHGETLGATRAGPAFIAEGIRSEGSGFVERLTGSFALLVLDEDADRLYAVTDRVRSRRVFASGEDGTYWLSSDLAGQPTGPHALDPVGVAWFVANKAYFLGRTMFDGIRILDRSRVHELTERGIQGREYWVYQPGDASAEGDEVELSLELERLLVGGVERAVQGGPELFLSLSAGFDSRAIAGVLARRVDAPRVRCFSYGPGSAPSGPETDIARWTAGLLGYPHRTLTAYRGSLPDHLRTNAQWTEGMTRPADELDAWRALSTELDLAAHPVILAGDINSGLDGKPPRSEEALRRALRFRALRLPTAVEEVLTVGFRDTVHAGMATDFQEMMTRAAPHADGYESMRQYLTFDQKMINQVLPWRERFAGRFATVRSPWLDRDVLDFMTRVPRYLRADRKLFKDTVTRMFPDVFEKERVQSLNRPDLRAELIRHAEELRRWMATTSSRLDELMPPDFGRRLLDLEATAAGRLQQRGARLRRRGRNRLSRLFGPAATPEAKPLPPSEVFRRWAILRIALETA